MKPVILCVEDESEVRDAVRRDLSEFTEAFTIEEAEDVSEAREVVTTCLAKNIPIALALCDHLLPGENGVAFLVELAGNEDTRAIRKVLLTGQAGHEDTIHALNDAKLDYYLAKPWTKEELIAVVRNQLTEFVLGREESLTPFVKVLDGPRLMDAMSKRQPGW